MIPLRVLCVPPSEKTDCMPSLLTRSTYVMTFSVGAAAAAAAAAAATLSVCPNEIGLISNILIL